MKTLDATIPIGRMAKPHEIGNVVAFLAGRRGQLPRCDDGLRRRRADALEPRAVTIAWSAHRQGEGGRQRFAGRDERRPRPSRARWSAPSSARVRQTDARVAPTPPRTDSRLRNAARSFARLSSARRRVRPRAYRSSKVRRPMGSASAALGRRSTVRDPELVEREVRSCRQTETPLASAGSRQAEVRMPAERDRDTPTTGCGDGHRHSKASVERGDVEIDAVRERKRWCVHVDRRAQPGRVAAGLTATDAPARLADEQAVHRQSVVVGLQAHPGEVDGDAGHAVAARREPVRPRCQQGKSHRAPAPQRRQPAGEREVLRPAMTQRDSGHPERGEERRVEVTRVQRDRGFVAKPVLLDADAGLGHAGVLPTRTTVRRGRTTLP